MSQTDRLSRSGTSERDRLAELGQLAGDLVHELKNPISVILLNSQLLLTQDVPAAPEQQRARLQQRIQRMSDSARNLQEIVQSFLGFARPSRPDPDAIDLNALLAKLLEEQSDLLDQARVHLSFHRDDALALLAGDAQHLRSIFTNLITNARQALSERPISATTPPRKLLVITRAAKGMVRVVIANNGPPFAERVAAHLFQPFVSTKEDGTGLGLAIVRRLVELHHGTITASSDPSQGVSFTLEFPTSLGPAKARTQLPMPSIEAKVRSETSATAATPTAQAVLDRAPAAAENARIQQNRQAPPSPAHTLDPIRATRQLPRRQRRSRRSRTDGE